MNLNDLKVVGYDPAEGCASTVYLQKLDESGYTVDDLIWEWVDVNDPDEGVLYGWYSDAGEGSDEPLSQGEGVWVQAPSAEYKIEVSGQVYQLAFPIQLQAGFTMCANPVPAALNLNNATVSGYDPAEGCASTVYLQKLDASGYTVDDLIWEWVDVDDPDEGVLYGWYSDAGEGSDEPLGVGEAVWVQAPSNAYYLNFPAAY